MYAVVYIERATGNIEFVVARSIQWGTADTLVASLQPSSREGCYFTARNESELVA